MTLDEQIKIFEDNAEYVRRDGDLMECLCFQQLAFWLTDYKRLLEKGRRGHWVILDECSNEGIYCSECHKKVYRLKFAPKVKCRFCPNCGSRMEDINEPCRTE